jgi:hypothetical protein
MIVPNDQHACYLIPGGVKRSPTRAKASLLKRFYCESNNLLPKMLLSATARTCLAQASRAARFCGPIVALINTGNDTAAASDWGRSRRVAGWRSDLAICRRGGLRRHAPPQSHAKSTWSWPAADAGKICALSTPRPAGALRL